MNKERIIKEDDDVIKFIENMPKPTTYLNDYKFPLPVPEPDKQIYKKNYEPTRGRKKVSTFNGEELKRPNIPFSFYIKPRAINQRHKLFDIEDKIKILLQEIKPKETIDRPRVFKCPEVSLDDIDNKDLRDMIIRFMYTSETKRAIEECIKNKKFLLKERPGLKDWVYNKTLRANAECRDILYRKNDNKIFPGNWTKKGEKEFAYNDPRFQGQPTKNFWEKKEIHGPSYNPLESYFDKSYGEYAYELAKQQKLRLPHMKLDLPYMGYRPKRVDNIPLEKKETEPSDFWFTTNQFYGYTAPQKTSQCHDVSK